MFQNFKRIPYKLEILILTAIPVITIVEWFHMHIISYRCGFNNSISWGFVLILIYEPLKIAFVILAIIRFTYVKHVKKLNKYFNTAILSFLMFVGSWIIPFFCVPPGAVFFLKGFEKRIYQNVDVKAIQTWLLSGDADKYFDNNHAGNFHDDLPDFITNVKPKYIYFKAEKSGKGKYIKFEWGGVFAHWVIVVGLQTTKTKQQGIIEEAGSSNVEIRHPIIPGVYIFYDG